MNADDGIEALVRRLVEEGIGRGDESVIDELMSLDCIEHQRGNGSGAEGAKQVARTLNGWFSDFSLTVEDIAVSGDVVWTRNRARGVNTGSVMGRPPTGKSIDITVFDSLRVQDGRAVEHWGVPDQLGMLMQLGLLPAGGPPEART